MLLTELAFPFLLYVWIVHTFVMKPPGTIITANPVLFIPIPKLFFHTMGMCLRLL